MAKTLAEKIARRLERMVRNSRLTSAPTTCNAAPSGTGEQK